MEFVLLNDENKLSLVINSIPRDAIVAFDTETTDIDTQKAQIVGFSFAYEKNKAYYGNNHWIIKRNISELAESLKRAFIIRKDDSVSRSDAGQLVPEGR